MPVSWLARLRPRHLLAIDAVGAAITGLLTAFVLAPGRLPTGLPPQPLYGLATVAAAFCLYGSVALATKSNAARALRVLAAANGAYCVATATLCLTYWTSLTRLGGLYFAGEIAIIVSLASAERSATRQLPATPPVHNATFTVPGPTRDAPGQQNENRPPRRNGGGTGLGL